jgi:peptidyl-prolyl isomerase H (cyclophilin H)
MQLYAPKRNSTDPVVFLDISAGGQALGRIKIELFSDICPKTAENFRQLCTGEFRVNGVPIGYKNSSFHRVTRGLMIHGGDFVQGDGTGSQSIYGVKFPVENYTLKHDTPGLVAMVTSENSSGCQFYITCAPAEYLDAKHCIFGAVLDKESMHIVRTIENLAVVDSKPKLPVIISECGEL